MKLIKKIRERMLRFKVPLIYLSIFLAIIFTSYGYAALNTDLSISGETYVRVDKDIRITNINVVSSENQGYETYNSKYSKDTTSMFTTLPNNNSSVTYEITVKNKSSDRYILSDLIESTYSNKNIKYELIGLKVNDIIDGKEERKFKIKLTTNNNDQICDLVLNYKFEKVYKTTLIMKNLNSDTLSVEMVKGSNKNVTITPFSGYYLNSVSCTNGYEVNATIGESANSQQNITISNNNVDSDGTCTFKAVKPIKSVNIGDYIKYYSASNTYTINKSETGYSENQVMNPSELKVWRVIKKNNDGTVESISDTTTSTNLYLYGKTGYNNFVQVMYNLANQYGDKNYVLSTRPMGYNNQTLKVNANFSYPAPYTSTTSDNSNESAGGGDILYQADVNLVNNVYKTLVAKNPSGSPNEYWIASREFKYWASNYFEFCGRTVKTDGTLMFRWLCTYNGGFLLNKPQFAFRPIVVFKSNNLLLGGSGTITDPYILKE